MALLYSQTRRQGLPATLQMGSCRLPATAHDIAGLANRHPIESREWQVPDPVLEEFYNWVVEEELITLDELTEQTADAAVSEDVRRNLRGELLNSAFGIEARYEVIAEGDPQILEALTLFDDAKSLLARRQLLLDDDSQPEKTASLPD